MALSHAFTNALKLREIFVSAKDFPYLAKGDNSADDTTPIQNALDTVNAQGGGTVFLPEGTYRVGAISIPPNVFLSGSGQKTKLRRKSGAGAGTALLTLNGGNGVGLNGVKFLTVDGYKAGSPGAGTGVRLYGAYRAVLEEVWIKDCGETGLDVDQDGSANPSKECWLSKIYTETCTGNGIWLHSGAWDCVLDTVESGQNGQHGIVFSGAAGSRISKAASYWNGWAGFQFYQGMEIQGDQIRSERNSGHGIEIVSCQELQLTNIRSYKNSSSDYAGTGRNVNSGIHVSGALTAHGIVGCKNVYLQGHSGDGPPYSGQTNLPYQKYGLEEAAGGTFVNTVYDLTFGDAATAKYSLASGSKSVIRTLDHKVIVNGGTLSGTPPARYSGAHNHGSTPDMVHAFLQCTVNDGTYVVGDRIYMSTYNEQYVGIGGLTVAADSTNLYAMMGPVQWYTKSGAVSLAGHTSARWDIYLVGTWNE